MHSNLVGNMNRKDWTLIIAIIMLVLIMASIRSQAQNFYSDLNEYRKAHFLKPLKIDSALEVESMIRVNKIIKNNRALSHGSVKDIVGEVVAKNCDSDLQCWLDSPGHKKIILSRKARRIGYVKIDGISCARVD